MTLSIALACALAAIHPGEPPLKYHRTPALSRDDYETYIRDGLAHTRGAIALLEGHIRWSEKFDTEYAYLFTTDELRYMQEELDGFRGTVRFWREYERELLSWQERRKSNPSPEADRATLTRLKQMREDWTKAQRIAPMPREVKR
jgi:hypothetical protein